MNTERPTPRTDAEEERQRDCYENDREVGWPAFYADFDFARQLERELAEAREELARLNAGPNNELRKTVLLRDYSEIIDHLQRCQDAEDEKLGDMGHDYFEQAITAIKDLEALVIDLTTHQTQTHHEPLPRPDGPGWWWQWIHHNETEDNDSYWAMCEVLEEDFDEGECFRYHGLWLPATPPPAHEKGVEG